MKPINLFATFSFKPRSTPTLSRTIILAISTAGFLACAPGMSPMRVRDHAGLQSSKAAGDKLLPEDSRKIAPGFSLTDAKGEDINLSAYEGKVVLLDFWATWCTGCKREIPWYMEFDKKYKDQGLAVIGVAMDDDGWKSVRPFLALKRDPETGGNTAMQYPVVIGSNSLAKRYNLTSLPMTLLIDREGRIALSHTGIVNKDDFEGHILQLLN